MSSRKLEQSVVKAGLTAAGVVAQREQAAEDAPQFAGVLTQDRQRIGDNGGRSRHSGRPAGTVGVPLLVLSFPLFPSDAVSAPTSTGGRHDVAIVESES